MTYVIVKHKVKDFSAWKSVFESVESFRKSHGEKSHRIFAEISDRNHVFGLFEYESADAAKSYFESDELKQKMNEAGVVEVEGIYYLEEH